MTIKNPNWGEERIADELFLKIGIRMSSVAELLCGTDNRKYPPRMLEPRDRDQRVAPASNSEKLLYLLPSVEDASVFR